MAAGNIDLVITYGVIPGTTDAFKIGTSGAPYQGSGNWETMSDAQQESRRIIHSNDGPFSMTRDSKQVKISFSFMTVQTSALNLKKEIQLIETVFSQKWKDVKLEINEQEQYSFSHTDATGFESSASLTKGMGTLASSIDGSFSRNYKAVITVGLPHDQNYYEGSETGLGITGLASSQVDVTFNADNKKTVTISGAYSALPTSPAYANPDDEDESTETGVVYARDQFEAEIDDYCSAVLYTIGGEDTEFEVSFQSTTVPTDSVLTEAGIARGKMITFNRKYDELFFQEGPIEGVEPNTFDAAKIKEQSLIITPKLNRTDSQSKGSKSNRYGVPLVSASVVYLCTFDRMEFLDDEDNPTYLTIEDFKEQYDLLRPWLIEKVKETLSTWSKTDKGGFFVMSENVGYNCDAYKITVNMGVAALSLEGGSRFTGRSLTYSIVRNYGKTLVPIWDKKSEYAKYLFQGVASRTLTMNESWQYVGTDQDVSTLWEKPNFKDFSPSKNWKFVIKSATKDFAPLNSGIAPDNMLKGDYSQKYVVEYYTTVGAAAAKRGQTIVVHREPGRGVLGVPRHNVAKFGGD